MSSLDWSSVPTFGDRTGDGPWVIRPSAYVIARDRAGRLALVRTREGMFLPGGGIEAGETPDRAARREALEECGLVVRVGAWITRAVAFVYSPSERVHFEKRSTFLDAAVERADGTGTEAFHELVWVEVAQAPRALTDVSHRWAVERWTARSA